MKHSLSYFAILIVLLYALANAYLKKDHTNKIPDSISETYARHTAEHSSPHTDEELSRIGTPEYTKRYITNIIDHGSRNLHFKKDEIMEKGFVSGKDAPKVACYVLTLAGDACDYPKEASLLYTSNCAGCHGNDGKGMHGTYPDLTRRPLLGVELRRELLENMHSRK